MLKCFQVLAFVLRQNVKKYSKRKRQSRCRWRCDVGVRGVWGGLYSYSWFAFLGAVATDKRQLFCMLTLAACLYSVCQHAEIKSAFDGGYGKSQADFTVSTKTNGLIGAACPNWSL